jgi:hypothetical protein
MESNAFAESGNSPPTDVINELRAAWQEFKTVERRGIAFGQRLYELRAASSAQGNHEGKGFLPLLQEAGIPQRTAYYWIHSYELSIGLREEKVTSPVMPDTPVTPDDAQTEWDDAEMPEFVQKKVEAYATIVFRCATKKDLDALARVTKQTLTPKTKSAWFPYKPHRRDA